VTRPEGSPRASVLGRRVKGVLVVLGAVAAVAVMVALSLWQWDRARERGSLQNYSYAVEWLVFAALTVVGLLHLARESGRADREPPPERREEGPLIGPPLEPGQELEELTWVRLRRRIGLGRD
jgi:cytochrome oxidase assembly protein ShyY1